MREITKTRSPVDKPRYVVGAILFYKAKNPISNDGMIDMGWNSGMHKGIYLNVFRDRGRILFAKRKHRIMRKI